MFDHDHQYYSNLPRQNVIGVRLEFPILTCDGYFPFWANTSCQPPVVVGADYILYLNRSVQILASDLDHEVTAVLYGHFAVERRPGRISNLLSLRLYYRG